MSMYTYNESRVRIDNRVRKIFLATVLKAQNDTLTSRVFAIHYEIKHGTIHAVRSAFESAVSSPILRSSAGLWRLYIIYCLQQFPTDAKDVWYRALRACPWAKELYIVGFEHLEGILEYGELKATWKVMGEKELRIHVDLEDKFEEIGDVGELSTEKRLRKLGFK
jgi:hypothetical protein